MKRLILLIFVMLVAMGLSVGFAEDDPFAGLEGDDALLAGDDGASSIRAKKKASPYMFKGIVQRVKKSGKNFPKVEYVKIKVTKLPKKQSKMLKMFKKGKTYEFKLAWKEKDGKLDFSNENNRLNIGAWYLEKGDKVEGIIKEKDGQGYLLEFLQR